MHKVSCVQVTNEHARNGGLDVSLFEQLAEARPAAVAPLTVQYRMNADIMHLSNKLTYNGALSVGSEEVGTLQLVPSLRLHTYVNCSEQRLHICNTQIKWASLGLPDDALNATQLSAALRHVLDQNESIVFIDTSQSNHTHFAVSLACESINRLVKDAHLEPSDFICMSPYNLEVSALQRELHSSKLPQNNALTVDRAQGMDKRCAIVCVGSGHASSILNDWRRLNVALTRARHKLVLIGSTAQIQHNAPTGSPLRTLVSILQTENRIVFA